MSAEWNIVRRRHDTIRSSLARAEPKTSNPMVAASSRAGVPKPRLEAVPLVTLQRTNRSKGPGETEVVDGSRQLGKVADVPAGSVVAFQVEGKKVAVANVDGRLFAFDDACTHRGCSLATGSLTGTSVTCPCHGSVFQVTDGSVINGPATRPLLTYDVEVVGGEISISLGAASAAGDRGSSASATAPPSAPGPRAQRRAARRPGGRQARSRGPCIRPALRRSGSGVDRWPRSLHVPQAVRRGRADHGGGPHRQRSVRRPLRQR